VGTGRAVHAYARRAAAHPHGRGDRKISSASVRAAHGSPPRAWGPERFGGRLRFLNRLTPTGVGTGRRGPSWRHGPAAHPRGRGDRSGSVGGFGS